MAVVAVDGGDERARAREGESREGRRGRERVRERSEGVRHLRGVAGDVQGEEEAARQGGGGRGAWPRAPGACPSSWQGRKATGG